MYHFVEYRLYFARYFLVLSQITSCNTPLWTAAVVIPVGGTGGVRWCEPQRWANKETRWLHGQTLVREHTLDIYTQKDEYIQALTGEDDLFPVRGMFGTAFTQCTPSAPLCCPALLQPAGRAALRSRRGSVVGNVAAVVGTGAGRPSWCPFAPPAAGSRSLWFRRHVACIPSNKPRTLFQLSFITLKPWVVPVGSKGFLVGFSPFPASSFSLSWKWQRETVGGCKLRYRWWDLWSHWPLPVCAGTPSPWVCCVSKTEGKNQQKELNQIQQENANLAL